MGFPKRFRLKCRSSLVELWLGFRRICCKTNYQRISGKKNMRKGSLIYSQVGDRQLVNTLSPKLPRATPGLCRPKHVVREGSYQTDSLNPDSNIHPRSTAPVLSSLRNEV